MRCPQKAVVPAVLSVPGRRLPHMTHDPQTIAWLDQEDARLAQLIRTRFAVQYVWSGDEPDEPGFGYTVGLFGLGHPELVVTGLDHHVSHALLNRVARMVVGGRDLVPGEVSRTTPARTSSPSRCCPTPPRSSSRRTASTSGRTSSPSRPSN